MKLWLLPLHILTEKEAQGQKETLEISDKTTSKLLADNFVLSKAVEELRKRLPAKKRGIDWTTLSQQVSGPDS